MKTSGALLSHVATIAVALGLTACGGSAPATASAPASGSAAISASVAPSGGAAAPASSVGSSKQWSPATQQLIAAAQKEGHLDLSWGSGLLGGSEGAPKLAAGMNQLFGTNIQVQFTPGGSEPETAAKMVEEQQGGKPAVSDVYVGAGGFVVTLVRRKGLETVDWPALLPGRITPEMVENGVALRFFMSIPGAMYNPKQLPSGKVPKTMQDFLDPAWKGRLASTPYAASFDFLAAKEAWGPTKTLDYVRQLSGQIGGLLRCGEAEQRIVSGEFAAHLMDCGDTETRVKLTQQGAPIQRMIPADAAQMRYKYLGVPTNATHPNAAKLFTAFMMTSQGQALEWDTSAADLEEFPASHMRPQVAQLEKQGAKFFAPKIQYLLDHPELAKETAQMVKLLTAKKS